MTEDFLHYIWRYGLYSQDTLFTLDQLPITVLDAGQYNTDAGPDFQQAKIRIGSSVWVGHVEIHLRSSDWYHHGHQHDAAYNQVILHVVQVHDREVRTAGGVEIPTARLIFNERYYENFKKMVNQIAPIPCHVLWKGLSVLNLENAIVCMGIERMESRFFWLREKLEMNKGGWKELFLQVIFRAFGFGKNQENFDFLAQSIPYGIMSRYRSNLFQLESLIFGQAGLLPDRDLDSYTAAVRSEFKYLKVKHDLQISPKIYWRSRRTRPGNQAIVRLAQLAAWIHHNRDLFDLVRDHGLSNESVKLDFNVSSYWQTHSDFGKLKSLSTVSFGEGARILILINAILPLNAFFNHCHFQGDAMVEWMERLETLPAERNYVLRLWQEAGFRVPNAFYSQAFLHLYKTYCSQRHCVKCRIGQMILQS